MRMDVVLRVATKLLLPLMLVFGAYVQLHGEYSPGGGFQAGVIVGAAGILFSLVYGLEATTRIMPVYVVEALIPLGAVIFAGVGVVGFLAGDNYLAYGQLAGDPKSGQKLGIILVEAGVFVTVSATVLAIFYAFAGRGVR